MAVPSLAQIIHRKLIKNITSPYLAFTTKFPLLTVDPVVTDVGVMPYDIVRPILLKLENPQQLKILEGNSPQLCGADEEIWIGFIKRDIPDWESKILYPRNPASWWKVYQKLIREHEKEVQTDAAALKAQFSRLKKEKEKLKPEQLEEIRKIPKMDGMQFAHIADYNKVKKIPKDTRPTSVVLRLNAGSNTRVLTGKGVVKKSEREARELTHFTSNTHLSIPTHQLKEAASKVLALPPGLVDDFRRAAIPKPMDPTVPKPAMFVPPTRRIERNPVPNVVPPGMMTTEERERRLRALTTPGRVASAPKTSEPQTTSTTSQSSTDRSSTANASITSSSTAKPTTTTDKKLPAAPAIPQSNPPKRKAEALSTVPSRESTKRPSVSNTSTPVSSTAKSITTTGKKLPSASPVPSSTQLKRKAEEPAILPSVESIKRSRIANASTPSSSGAKSTTTTDRKLPPAPPIPNPNHMKRKAEEPAILPSIESPKRPRVSNASIPSYVNAKSTITTEKKLSSASSIPQPTDLKRKAEDSSIVPSIEPTNSQPIRSGSRPTNSQPIRSGSSDSSVRRSLTPYRVPKLEGSDRVINEAVRGPPKRKTPVSCFIPPKKRRLS
ncbi:MAG: hypothetical protein Q9212_003227 [Teloschistes hypoglaucus]